MAKCQICNSRKGKRKCIAQGGLICSLCCGESRSPDKCAACSYSKEIKSSRNYRKVPHFPLSRMSNDFDLQDQTNVIESAICQFDEEQNRNLNDKGIIKILELLLNRYHFQDENLTFSNKLEGTGYIAIDRAIAEDLSSLTHEEISKLLATVYRSTQRHVGASREYIEFIHGHVGIRMGKGARLLKRFSQS
jgi:hypothetical protein